MPGALRQKDKKSKIDPARLPAIDRLLIAGIKLGPAAKRDAINKVLQLAPEWTRGDCWRRIRLLRKTPEFAALNERQTSGNSPKGTRGTSCPRPGPRRWTPADDYRLLFSAGYKTVKEIAHRLGRTVAAVRFRLGSLGMSARATDGWSLRTLRKTLHVRHTKLRHLIGSGILVVRDSRISAESVAAFCEKHRASLDPSTLEKVTTALAKGAAGYTSKRAADLFGVSVSEIQTRISAGSLRIVDTYVTDRAFEEFCKDHGEKINTRIAEGRILVLTRREPISGLHDQPKPGQKAQWNACCNLQKTKDTTRPRLGSIGVDCEQDRYLRQLLYACLCKDELGNAPEPTSPRSKVECPSLPESNGASAHLV